METKVSNKIAIAQGVSLAALMLTATAALAEVDPATLDGAGIENTVTASGTYGTGDDEVDVEHESSENVDVVSADPEIDIVKVATVAGAAIPATGAEVGDVITYTYTVTNTGNVTVNGVGFDDQHTTAAGTSALTVAGCALSATNPGPATSVWTATGITTFVPDDVFECTATYTVTQADVDTLQ